MSTGGFTRTQHPWLEDARLPSTESPLQEQGSHIERAKIRKKAIRNAKDSAEMARIRYERRWGSDGAQATMDTVVSKASKLGPNLGLGSDRVMATGQNDSKSTQHRTEKEVQGRGLERGAAQPNSSAFQAPPLTPPDTSSTQAPPGLYWHDGLHASAAALNRLPSGSHGLSQRTASFDSTRLALGRASSELYLPIQDFADAEGQSISRRRSSSFDSAHATVLKQRSRPQSQDIPQTAGALDVSFLTVPIPHYRLGSPRFSERGTAFLQNSLHTALSSTADIHTSSLPCDKPGDNPRLCPSPSGQRQPNFTSLRRSPTSWFSPSVTPGPEETQPTPLAISFNDDTGVPASVYDRLAADLDNPLWVKHAPQGKQFMAATTVRLVMEITSVKFLDYELISDFFLMYRCFMTPADLARHLFARMRWAVSQNDSTGRIVRVRTFVALRHWVLNYFVDDFEPNIALRVLFCDLVNHLSLELQQRQDGGGGDMQILEELKKCWKRACALVWESDDVSEYELLNRTSGPSDAVSSDSGIGIPNMTPARSVTVGVTAQERQTLTPSGRSYFTHGEPDTTRRTKVPDSPFSESSIHAFSCSIPIRSRRHDKSGKPVMEEKRQPMSQSPQNLQRQSSQLHQRGGSFSDALRDDRSPTPVAQSEILNIPEVDELLFRGGLIRGTLLPPNQVTFVIPGPISPLSPPRHQRSHVPNAASVIHTESTSNPAVLKLIGGVRRVLSNRHTSKPSLTSGHKPSSSADLRKSREARLVTKPSANLEQSAKREPPRSDALAALVARSWEEQPRDSDFVVEGVKAEAVHDDTSTYTHLVPAKERPLGTTRFNSHVSTGSRSILIVDDTTATRPSSSQRAHGTEPGHETVRAMQRTSAPLSPPPNTPLPAIPSNRGSASRVFETNTPVHHRSDDSHQAPESHRSQATPLSQIGLAFGTPSDTVLHPKRGPRESSLSIDCSKDDDVSQPRLLRRRPGGNLKAVDTIQDLGTLLRRQSTGSVSSPGLSSTASPIVSREYGSINLARSWSRAKLQDRATDGQLGRTIARRSLRLLSTHSSQPNLRPSFELEFRKLALLPGDEDEGDIESTLLKLEGRYRPGRHSVDVGNIVRDSCESDLPRRASGDGKLFTYLDFATLGESIGENGNPGPDLAEKGPIQASIYDTSHGAHQTVIHLPEQDVPEQAVLRDKPATDPEIVRSARHWRRSSQMMWSPDHWQTSFIGYPDVGPAHHTRDKSEAASSNHTNSSFLLDDNESLCDQALAKRTGKAVDTRSEEEPNQSFLFDDEEDEAKEGGIGDSPNRTQTNQRPLTPPTSAGASFDAASLASAFMLSPGPKRDAKSKAGVIAHERSFPDLDKQINYTPRKPRKAAPTRLHVPRHIPTLHTPFVLAYSSSALAAQFTLIEKDALDCIDWKDLVNLSWSQDSYMIRDWAQYTHSLASPTNKISSIDLIIARFNLVIKWCISSVLLCATPKERAACITKFIHIATHAHEKLRNFATTAQLTIGLLSSDLTRLKKTWELVPTPEKDALKKLELLVSPVRNFAALRSEMESAAAVVIDDAATSPAGDGNGVIPFVGVYTRDLALNAQKSALLAPETGNGPESNGGGEQKQEMEQLINFERYRTAATIVKGVLRLLDASARYTIKPQQEVLSRCLWLAALTDGELASLSRGLE